METKELDLEIINKLYLELSQISTAKTHNDILLETLRTIDARRMRLIAHIFNCDEVELLPNDLQIRMMQEFN